MTNTPWSQTNKASIIATPDEVFAALTSSERLEHWFAEHAHVDPVLGGAYQFWGEYTIGMPTTAPTSQRITVFEVDKQLGFTWDFNGSPSEVLIVLAAKEVKEDDAPVTLMTVTHTFETDQDRDLVDDYWRLILGNLGAEIQGGDGLTLLDFSDKEPMVRQAILINAPREKVFKALLDP